LTPVRAAHARPKRAELFELPVLQAIENRRDSYIVRRHPATPVTDLVDLAGFFSGKAMMERDDDHFDLDDDFVAESDEVQGYEKFIDSGARRARPSANAGAKKGKAAWSKLEDVLADRRLKKELNDFEQE
jgi:hypothetical protein